MAEEQTGQERTEPATPKRREDARKKGQVAKSRELPTAAAILGGAMFFWMAGGRMVADAGGMMRAAFGGVVREDLSLPAFQALLVSSAADGIRLMTPLLAVMLVVGIASNVLQTGPLASLQPLVPKLSKISPAAGFKRIFSAVTLMELFKSVVKLVVICAAVWFALAREAGHLPALAAMRLETLLPYLGRVSFRIAMSAGLILLVMAAVDYGFQRYEHEKRLRMSRQEIKREFKETEGDPMVRARIRSIQREAARKRMMADVPRADVVVTNPTHLAVALKYDGASMAAPKVVAKGAGHVAARIRELARQAGVPVMEDKPLARALFKAVEVGREIPFDLYQAVAEVLAFVYRMNDKRRTVAG
jgi:flagellar biosynthetic protein FlhB